jgi:hypothetical protein
VFRLYHDYIKTLYPKEFGYKYIIPHLLTVAGEAAKRSIDSKIMLIGLLIAIIYPLFRHNFLLSSSTVFMFSIHKASTGPSKINHFRFGSIEEAKFLNFTGNTPSNHSWDTESKEPYNWSIVIDFGLILHIST